MKEWVTGERLPGRLATPRTRGSPVRSCAPQVKKTDYRQRSSMSQTHTSGRGAAATALLVLLLACTGLAACGGSSSTSSSGTNAAGTGASTSSTSAPSTGTSSTGTSSTSSSTGTSSTGSNAGTPPPGARGPVRFSAMRACLQKNGITLPKPGAGAGVSRLGLPKGVTPKQYEAAVKKCGGGRFFGGGTGFRRANSPAFRQALTKYAACLRQNGVNLPAPNTSGKGPIFSTKGLNSNSPQFRAATLKCRAVLVGALRGRH